MTINRIITNRFKLEIQSKKANWTQTAGSVDWTEFSVDWPCTWKFSRFKKLSVSSFQSTEQSFQSTDPVPGNFPGSGNFLFPGSVDWTEFSVDWIMPGNSRVSGSVDWTEFSVDWIMPGLFFSLIQMKSKLFQNAIGRTLALRVYANRQPGPICSSMHHQKHVQTSIKGLYTYLT